ncbi:MAG: M48 family metalloprotease [Alteromonadaceae bacterium]|nr:M48 family metalloprotease [Alteromonadaceae bacterium]
MNYTPKQPDNGVNVSQVHPLKDFTTLLAGVTVFVVFVYWVLGFTIDIVVDHLPDDFETSIELVDSRLVGMETQASEPLQALVNQLSKCSSITKTPQVFLAENPEANAVALPNNQIWVYQGLIDKLETENGLAFVLAHEISHFQNKDHLRAMGRGLVLAGVSALLLGSNSDLTNILTPGSIIGEANYSQARESAADAEALSILHCHYDHVAGASEFFNAMLKEDRQDFRDVHLLSSHPNPEKRVAELEQIAEEKGFNSLTKELKPLPELLSQ